MKHFPLPGVPQLRKAATRIALLTAAMLTTNLIAQAQVVFDNFTDIGPPPTTLGGYKLTPVTDNRANASLVTSVPSPLGGNINFSNELTIVTPGFFFPWGHGYSGKAYGNLRNTSTTLTLPPGTKAFYFYAKPLLIGSSVTAIATTTNGSTAVGTKNLSWRDAQFFGFHVTNPNDNIKTIQINLSGTAAANPYQGEFGIGQCSNSTITPTASNGGVLTCTNPTLTLTAPAGGTGYTFTGPNGFSQSGAGNTASVAQPGTYSVMETLSSGCQATGSVTITENKTVPTNVVISNDGPLTCAKTSVTLTASSTAGTSYAFSGPNGFSQNGAATTASVTAPGTYSVVVKGANGCSAIAQTTTVGSNTTTPDGSFTGLAGTYCADAAAVTLTPATSGGTFGGPGVSGNTFTPANAGSGGSITYTVTSAANGCIGTSSQSVVVNPVPTPAITGLAAAYCQNVGAVALAGSPADGQFTIDGQNATQLDPASLSAGSHTVRYTVTVNGCTAFTEQTVVINAPPTLTPGPDKSVILGFGGPNSTCTDITATASGGGGSYTYVWNPGNLNGQTVTVCPQATTTYEVKATDANGCVSAPAQVTVKVKDVRCGPGDKSVTICYYGVTQCVSEKIAQRYLKLGATLGGCGTDNARLSAETEGLPLELSLKSFPNPTPDAVTVEVLAPRAGVATFEVLDMAGRARQSRKQELAEGRNEIEFKLGALPTGIYLIRCIDPLNRQATVRVSRQ